MVFYSSVYSFMILPVFSYCFKMLCLYATPRHCFISPVILFLIYVTNIHVPIISLILLQACLLILLMCTYKLFMLVKSSWELVFTCLYAPRLSINIVWCPTIWPSLGTLRKKKPQIIEVFHNSFWGFFCNSDNVTQFKYTNIIYSSYKKLL